MASSKVWFILSEGQVSGPFNHDEVESHLVASKNPQIWGRGQAEWVTPSRWRQNIDQNASTLPGAIEDTSLWRVRIDGQEKSSALPYPELISFLKSLKDFSEVDLRPEGNSGWKEIYSIPRVVDDLGITRRSNPRVPIIGTLNCEGENGEFKCRVISISDGGLGVNDAHKLKIGERFEGTLTSPNLFVTINATCEVVYVGNDGYAGLRFVELPAEFKSSIIEYVNKFST